MSLHYGGLSGGKPGYGPVSHFMRDVFTNLFIGFAGVFGLPFLHFLGGIAGNLLYFIPNKVRSVSLINVAVCFPQLSPGQQKQLTRAALVELCQWFFELGPVCQWPVSRLERLIVASHGVDAIREVLDQGRGVMLITPHYGNWELSALAGARLFPITIMYKPPGIKALHRHMLSFRTRAGASLVGTDFKGMKALFSALRRGEAIGLLTDQVPEQGAFVYAPFFGQPARTMTLFSKLLRKTNSAVFLSSMRRLPRGRGFVLNCTRLDERLLSDRDEVRAATYMNQSLEGLIVEEPAQYLWAYKRFKFYPDSRTRGAIYRDGPPGLFSPKGDADQNE